MSAAYIHFKYTSNMHIVLQIIVLVYWYWLFVTNLVLLKCGYDMSGYEMYGDE